MYSKLLAVTALTCSQVAIASVATNQHSTAERNSIDIVDRNRMVGMTLGAHPHVVPLDACQITSVTKHYTNNKLHGTEIRHVTFGESGRVEKLRRDEKHYKVSYVGKDLLIDGPVNYRIVNRDNVLYWYHSEDQRRLDSYAYRSFIKGIEQRKHITQSYNKAQKKIDEHWNTILKNGIYFGYGKKNETDVRWQWKTPNKVARYHVNTGQGRQVVEVHLLKLDARGNPTLTEAWLMGGTPKRVNTTTFTFKYCQ